MASKTSKGDIAKSNAAKGAVAKDDAGKVKGESPAKAPPMPAGADLPTSYAETQGHGGETHQTTSDPALTMTSAQGIPVADAQNSLKAGRRGPTLLEDFQLREKIFHFDHERIPERVVHARGYGAHGFFELTDSLSDYSRADVLGTVGQQTEVFVRFSTVSGRAGSRDLARDVRGFSVKMYTREGNWDLVGNNIPVFFIQDAIKFPDLIHAAKEEPDRGFPQAQTAHDNFWDFASLSPEAWHMIMWVMSDRAIPRSFRTMEGFGVHSFRLLDAAGKSTFVKFHWKPKQGLQSVLWNEAVKISGADPDYHRRDLWEAIESGDFPEWELGVQLFDEEAAAKLPFDHLDSTKLIPEEDVPVRIVGRLVLNRNVGQFLRQYRTGRVLHVQRRARHRLQRRPAAARAQLLVPRHAAEAAGRPQFHPYPGQCSALPRHELPAGRAYGDAQPGRPGELRAEQLGRPGRPARKPCQGVHKLRRAG